MFTIKHAYVASGVFGILVESEFENKSVRYVAHVFWFSFEHNYMDCELTGIFYVFNFFFNGQ